jgi:hypothetical protein
VTFNINGFMVVCYNLFLRTEEYVLKICLIWHVQYAYTCICKNIFFLLGNIVKYYGISE